MAQVPRIRRAEPSGPATQPRRGIPVIARLVWHDGATDEVEALAVAWTATEVEIEWTTPWHAAPSRLDPRRPGDPALARRAGEGVTATGGPADRPVACSADPRTTARRRHSGGC